MLVNWPLSIKDLTNSARVCMIFVWSCPVQLHQPCRETSHAAFNIATVHRVFGKQIGLVLARSLKNITVRPRGGKQSDTQIQIRYSQTFYV